jgi:hypothetical protein
MNIEDNHSTAGSRFGLVCDPPNLLPMLSLFVHAKRATPLLRRFALPQTRSFAAAEGASGVLNARIFVLLLFFIIVSVAQQRVGV